MKGGDTDEARKGERGRAARKYTTDPQLGTYLQYGEPDGTKFSHRAQQRSIVLHTQKHSLQKSE